MTRVSPNPYSPYADADPHVRHLADSVAERLAAIRETYQPRPQADDPRHPHRQARQPLGRRARHGLEPLMPKTVAVDFDGVIHAYSKGWQDGTIYDEPVPGALAAIHSLMAAEVAVFIHTTRNAEVTAGWLRARDVIAHSEREMAADGRPVGEFWNDTDIVLVTSRKLPAVAYIDDRAIRFESWEQALTDLEDLEAIVPMTSSAALPSDSCHLVDVDGETVRVRGSGEMDEQDREALGQVVRAAKARMQAERDAERAEIERQVRAKVAEEVLAMYPSDYVPALRLAERIRGEA